MKTLTAGEAARCEWARTGRCRCRCKGAFHGTRRAVREADLADLPEGDPHRPDVIQLALDLGPTWRQLELAPPDPDPGEEETVG